MDGFDAFAIISFALSSFNSAYSRGCLPRICFIRFDVLPPLYFKVSLQVRHVTESGDVCSIKFHIGAFFPLFDAIVESLRCRKITVTEESLCKKNAPYVCYVFPIKK